MQLAVELEHREGARRATGGEKTRTVLVDIASARAREVRGSIHRCVCLRLTTHCVKDGRFDLER
jgi:hypothetical protein